MAKDKKKTSKLDSVASLCKRRGFIFQTSEIYGGLNGFWDYGPMGSQLKKNIRDAWWQDIVVKNENVVGLDASIIMHPRVWEASGHIGGFSDPMVDCRECKKRFKADNLCEEQGQELIQDGKKFQLPEGIKCASCGSDDLTEPRSFDLMFKTFVGPVEDDSAVAYLRPETAQGIFAQFSNVLATSRQKLPFGIGQIGKAFRNEINPRNYTFRSREFEQMELEFFIKPGTDEEWHKYWVQKRLSWYESVGLPLSSLELDEHPKEKLAHYASACTDVAYAFPFGVQELEGIAARGNFDLSRHQEFSGKSMEYFDQETNERYIPHVVEPSAGVDRIALAILCEAYTEEWIPKGGEGEVIKVEDADLGKRAPEGYEARTVLKFVPKIAPVKVAVFPLLKNKPELVEKAREIFEELQEYWPCFWDVAGAIGRRYRRQDEIGTPFGVTIDFDTLEDNTVTIRYRDTMKQERISCDELLPFLMKKIR
ncbi:MAG: glycine--tRNA ligase [Kiritimatiellae bacterium]|jgi:glycyl-tRNA synthetase|nr:glycine--tRNA ligase [Kiritimatiellia bacterium]